MDKLLDKELEKFIVKIHGINRITLILTLCDSLSERLHISVSPPSKSRVSPH